MVMALVPAVIALAEPALAGPRGDWLRRVWAVVRAAEGLTPLVAAADPTADAAFLPAGARVLPLALVPGSDPLADAARSALTVLPAPPPLILALAADATGLLPGDLRGLLAGLAASRAAWAVAGCALPGRLWPAEGPALAGGFWESGALAAWRGEALTGGEPSSPPPPLRHPLPPARALRRSLLPPWEETPAAPRGEVPPPGAVKAVVFDFDGVFTDNRVWVDQEGRELVACHRGDGLGLDRLRGLGLPLLVLSTERNPVVAARCRKVQLPCRQGFAAKLPELMKWLAEVGVAPAGCAYLGNDLNDLACLEAVGWPLVVADAHPAVRPLARLVLAAPGGLGAVRELCDLLAPPPPPPAT